ncbi:MAG: TIGR02444 family protein [Alphaproteobacteria bacterium]
MERFGDVVEAGKKPSAARSAWPQSAFWTFSVDVYQRPGIEAACLALQDRHGLNVNLLLWALWLADCGVALNPPLLEKARLTVAPWQQAAVEPLRAVRRWLRERIEDAEPDAIAAEWPGQVAALRRSIIALELDGEHLTQLALGRLGDQLKPSRQASTGLAADNLACFRVFDEQDRGDLANLLKHLFPDAHQSRLDAALDGMFGKV